ncbi:MAG: helix-turn-helix domain-containing protein [Myxococcales bacterium]|nr:helix-turn-helix domain-containing protein [Myxococcales bacterium]
MSFALGRPVTAYGGLGIRRLLVTHVKTGGRLLTTREAAEILGVGPTTVKRWSDEGKLPALKTAGGHRRYRETDVLTMRHRGDSLDDIPARLPKMTPKELDSLSVGVVQVDDEGCVLFYSRRESEFSGVPLEQARGKNFFTEVAPCTNNRLVYEPFREGVARDHLDLSIEYTLSVYMSPTDVHLRLYRDSETRTNWIVIDPE